MLTVAERNPQDPAVEQEPQDRPSWRWRLSVIGLFLLVLLVAGMLGNEASLFPILWRPQTWGQGLALTLMLAACHAGILRSKVLGKMTYAERLWRSVVVWLVIALGLNLASLAFRQLLGDEDPFLPWAMAFPIAILPSVPMLRFLSRKGMSWDKAYAAGVFTVLPCFLLLPVPLLALLFLSALGGGLAETWEASRWQHPELLSQQNTRLYCYSGRNEHRFVQLDAEGKWQPVPGCPPMDPDMWDVEGSTLAFMRMEYNAPDRLGIARLSDTATLLREILPEAILGEENLACSVRELAVSPDERHVALLLAVACKQNAQDEVCEQGYRILIVNCESGEGVAQCSQAAVEWSLCWLGDSERVLFVPLAEDKRREYGDGLLHTFDMKTGEVAPFGGGTAPALASQTGQILVRRGDSLVLLSPKGEVIRSVNVGHMDDIPAPTLAPDGNALLCARQRRMRHYRPQRLVAIQLDGGELWHLVEPAFTGRVDWTTAPKAEVEPSEEAQGE